MRTIELLYYCGLWYLKNEGKVRQEWVHEVADMTYEQEQRWFHENQNVWITVYVKKGVMMR